MSAALYTIKSDPSSTSRKQTHQTESLFISEAEAAAKLGLHPVTLRRWRWEGRNCPPFVRMGAKLVSYPIESFKLWVDKVQRGEIRAGARNSEGAA